VVNRDKGGDWLVGTRFFVSARTRDKGGAVETEVVIRWIP